MDVVGILIGGVITTVMVMLFMIAFNYVPVLSTLKAKAVST